MQLGDLKLKVAAPSDLDAALLEATGCSAKEWREALKRPMLVGMVAQALFPFVASASITSFHFLVDAIEQEGKDVVQAFVARLYDGHAPAEEPEAEVEAEPEAPSGE